MGRVSSLGCISMFSVIIPTYNRASLLSQTLRSLKEAEKKKPVEVIVVDDGSMDDSLDIVREHSSHLDVLYAFQPDKGFRVSAARNIGIALANQDNCLFLDCGMIVHPKIFTRYSDTINKNAQNTLWIGLSYGMEEFSVDSHEKILNYYNNNSISDCFTLMQEDGQVHDSRSELLALFKDGDLSECRAPWVVAWGSHLCAPTEVIRSLGGFSELYKSWGGEDIEFGLRLHKNGVKLFVYPYIHTLHLPHERMEEAEMTKSASENFKIIHSLHEAHHFVGVEILDWKTGIMP